MEKEGRQPELFDMDQLIGPDIYEYDSVKRLSQKFRREGSVTADKISDQILGAVIGVIVSYLEEKGVDLDAELAKHQVYDSISELIEDSDSFYELTQTIAHDFIEGMDMTWFYPISEE